MLIYIIQNIQKNVYLPLKLNTIAFDNNYVENLLYE